MMYTLEGDKVKMKFWGINITRKIVCTNGGVCCRNPNLAKCGGEAQHLEKLGIWSSPGLPNV
jgi:hypothetical protein